MMMDGTEFEPGQPGLDVPVPRYRLRKQRYGLSQNFAVLLAAELRWGEL
jgi:hypothetical protein